MSIADLRNSYEKNTLLESSVAGDPISQFSAWFEQALNGGDNEPNAMTLATADAQGRPSARIVLLKGIDDDGLVFFTNYQSRKGSELTANPHASLLFFWPCLERQVRFEGKVERISAQESDAYFNSRPLGSRIGAWASPQSQAVTRDELEARWQQYAEQLGEQPPRPEHWGGFRLRPEYVVFWQGRPSRMHDRLVYERNNAGWQLSRLAT